MAQDYSLLGKTGAEAVASGLTPPKWYRTKVDPREIRKLQQKQDARPLRDAAIWLGGLVVSGTMAALLWPTWWSLPFWLIYCVLYASASDARWHECGHRTAFKTAWMNEVVYQIASFFLFRSPVVWRASHVRHHTDTIVVGRDPEIQQMRPPDLLKFCLGVFGLPELATNVPRWLRHVRGRLDAEEAVYVRENERPKVYLIARTWLGIYLAVIAMALYWGTILPLMLIGLPRFFGTWQMAMTGALQHLGLAENVSDHRLNTRTVMMDPINRFLYLNMNYHLEHHMFTQVPYYNLPALHALIKHDTPAPEPSIWAAYRRLLPVLWKQLRYHDAVIVATLPETAAPYRPEVERLLPHAA